MDQAEIILMMNPAGESLTGWSKDEALGGPVRQVFRLGERKGGRGLPIEDALRQRSLVEIRDGLLIAKNGARKPVSGNIAPLRDSTGGRAVR